MQKIYDFLKGAGTYYLATCDGDQPRVRPFGTTDLFDGRLCIQTGLVKDVAKQMLANPKVEISAMNGGKWIRLSAKAVLDERIEAQEHMLAAYPELAAMYKPGDGNSLPLEELMEKNPDVLGWICIPDSDISYPLMKAKDNQEYLYQTWDGKYSKYGSIFLECRNSHDFSDFNTLVYGHNMLTRDMFGTLSDYKDQAFSDSHPSVYIRLDEVVRRYDVFSCYDADIVSDTYRLIFEDDAQKQAALDLYVGKSLLESDLEPQITDHILTLSTCTGRGTANLRFVVQAILAKESKRTGP